jgi:uncharacterized protein
MEYDRELIRAGEKPEAAGWVPVSTRLATVRRLSAALVIAPVSLLVAVGLAFTPALWLALIPLVVGGVVLTWTWWLIGRQVAATAYSERTDDLVVRSGIMFRRTVVVPYGRMQLVDVSTGPIDRRFGIAAVQLHTAAATTDARIPGLPTEDAGRLRDHLAALGEARSAGL